MILTDVRDYLKSQGQASLRDMSLVFGMDQDALRPVIEQWINKGKVEKLPEGSACSGGCSACEPQTIELYQWID
ncbi:MAG: FeoC-like transcriptional regulator [Gammaproteobacteria bacterium]|nr:FeoC-like transcriptional regulator [Gammaproteobacteria bacterium]